jgi:TatD DNase family protein
VIDSHCHLDMPAFDADREEVWQRAREAGVRAVVIPSVEPGSLARTRSLARAGERFIALGIHPQVIPDLDDADVNDGLARLEREARDSKAVAIGECGLDGAIDLSRAPMERQKRIVAAHTEIACALDLPLILHVFRAHGEAADLLLRTLTLPRAGCVLHSYSGSAELAREYASRGFYISFAGAITRPTARKPIDAARAVPLERLLVETDAPDQPPTGAFASGANGRRCEPAHLPVTLARLAEVRGEDVSAVANATVANANTVFRLGIR